jgi:hypothetical protein
LLLLSENETHCIAMTDIHFSRERAGDIPKEFIVKLEQLCSLFCRNPNVGVCQSRGRRVILPR